MASRSRSRSSGRGGGGAGANKVLWFLIVAGIIFAFFRIPSDPGASGVLEIVKSKSENVQSWATSIAPTVGGWVESVIKGGREFSDPSNGGDTPNPDGGTTDGTAPAPDSGIKDGSTAPEADSKLNALTVANAGGVAYNRDEWKHWANVRSCWTVREEVLATEAVAGSLVLKDANKQVTTDLASACEIVSGKWVDPYGGDTYTNPGDLDIDHMIPLNYAAQHGGQAWDSAKKANYANNLDYADHLIAVEKGANRSKSDKGPSEWKPSDKGNWCTYSQNWINISSTWNLSTTEKDVKALKEMLATC